MSDLNSFRCAKGSISQPRTNPNGINVRWKNPSANFARMVQAASGVAFAAVKSQSSRTLNTSANAVQRSGGKNERMVLFISQTYIHVRLLGNRVRDHVERK